MDMLKHFKKCKITENAQEIAFDDFYNAYGNKVGKKHAQNMWQRMSKAKRAAAFEHIPNYKSMVNRRGIAMKDPGTYLNQEPWND